MINSETTKQNKRKQNTKPDHKGAVKPEFGFIVRITTRNFYLRGWV